MRNLYLVLGLFLFSLACGGVDNSRPLPENVELEQARQALVPGFCANHPALCTAWCNNHPVLCGIICNNFPNLPLCDDDEPMCIPEGDECEPGNDDEDDDEGESTPCCVTEEGQPQCFLNLGTQQYECALPVTNPSPCTNPNSECDPNGAPCCQQPNPFDIPIACLETDPSDPDTVFVCAPAF